MIYSFLLVFFLSTAHADTSIIDSSVIGCPMVSQNHYVKINSRVDIQKSYLYKFSSDKKKQDEIRKAAINFQLKYLVGAFKEFHTRDIFKATFSHFQGPTLITKTSVNTETYPEFDVFWPKDRGENSHPYIAHIMKEGKGSKEVESLQYEVVLHAFSCAKEKISSQQFVKALNELPFPKDPYIGFWINNKKERDKEFNRPDCFSYEFAIFGVPEQTWFFWSPIQHVRESQCKLS
ncbi:MAG: hypothetical protein K2Q18_17340, partial [Bdellovibrionales bacterium]|nr:hypothetical protein [Bdellovibrionales bacterium]